MKTVYSHTEQVVMIEKLQNLNLSLRHRLTEANTYLDNRVEDYKSVVGSLENMTHQRNEFMTLAKNLDKDFNNGLIFKKSNS